VESVSMLMTNVNRIRTLNLLLTLMLSKISLILFLDGGFHLFLKPVLLLQLLKNSVKITAQVMMSAQYSVSQFDELSNKRYLIY